MISTDINSSRLANFESSRHYQPATSVVLYYCSWECFSDFVGRRYGIDVEFKTYACILQCASMAVLAVNRYCGLFIVQDKDIQLEWEDLARLDGDLW